MTVPDEPKRLGLELQFESEPIRGRLYDRDDSGRSRAFSGWLGLLAAIDAARRGDPPPVVERDGERR